MPLIMGTPMETFTYHLSNTAVPLIGSACYLGLIKGLHTLMKDKKPIAVPKMVLLLYNLVQVLVNGYVAYVIAAAVNGYVFAIGLRDTPDVRYGVYLHYLCKYLDMIDTMIIVLRKKDEQLSFLHLWHHASIGVVWGWVVSTWPTGAEGGSAAYCYGAWVNACVHVIMYAYYGVTALGVKLPPPLKKAVTTVQLTQFASCIIIAVAALFLDVTPVFYNGVQVAYHIGMLRLFLPLLLGKKGKTPAGKANDDKSVAVPRTPAEKDLMAKSD